MDLYKISGEKKLKSSVKLHGAKNSALPILAVCVLVKGESVIHNCPNFSDVRTTIKFLKISVVVLKEIAIP